MTSINTIMKSETKKITILKQIADALKSDDISSADAKQMRTNIGISQSFFTRNKISKIKRKKQRKIQTESKRHNRKIVHGRKITSGQKMSGR